MSFTTQPKAGAPATVNIGPSVIETMVSATPLTWLLPIFGLIQPIEIDTADLCSQPPGYPESWGITDLLAGLDTAHHQDVRDKLIRMARANVWGTYCEFVPTGPAELPLFVHADVWNAEIWGSGASPQMRSATVTGVDFWALWTRCLEASTNGNSPKLRWGNSSDPTNPFLGVWNNTVGDELTSVIAVGSTWPRPDGGSPPVGFTPTGMWEISLNADDGRWGYGISAWSLDGRGNLPQPEVWAPAPAEPVPYQFSDAEAAALNLMASEWPAHRIGGALVPGMLGEISEDVAGILEAVEAEGPLQWSGVKALVSGGQIFNIPVGVRAAVVNLSIPAQYAQMGTSPGIVWEAGYYSLGTDNGWHPSERLKHTQQLVYPIGKNHVKMGVDLGPGVSGLIFWYTPT